MSKYEKRFKITEKVSLIVLSFAIIPMIFLAYFSSRNIFEFLKKQNMTYYHTLLKQVNENIDFFKKQNQRYMLEIVSNENFVKIIESNFSTDIERIRFLNSIGENSDNPQNGSITKNLQSKIDGYFSIIKVQNKIPKLLYESGDYTILNLDQVMIDPIFYNFKQNRDVVLGKFKLGVIINGKNDRVAMVKRVINSSNYQIYIIFLVKDLALFKLYDYITDLQNGLLLVMDDFNTVFHKNKINISEKPDKTDDYSIFDIENILMSPQIDRIINMSMKNIKNILITDVIKYKNQKFLLLSQYHSEAGYKLIYLLPLKRLNSPVYRLLSYIFLTTVILIVVILIASLFLSIFFTKPIETDALNIHNENRYFMNLAHEIKTPLTLINNYLDKYIKSVSYTDDLKIIKQNIDKLQRDMLNFLDTGKLERGQIFYNNNQIVNFSQFLDERVKLYKESANKKDILLDQEIDSDIYTKIDPLALDRIVNNLLDNAIKYTNKDGKILVSLKAIKNRAIFKVIDNGMGIDQRSLKYLFKPYHQIAHKKSATQGVGLGLYIISKVIESVKGEITVESKVGMGTTFIVKFLLSQKPSRENEDILTKDAVYQNELATLPVISSVDDGIYKENRGRILFVEDNRDLLYYLKTSFQDIYNVYVSENGVKALQKLEMIPKPDIVVSDLMMDEMDGYEFYQKLSSNYKFNDIPFIFLSAVTSFGDKLKVLESGAVDFINKPFSIEELKFKVNSLIRFQNIKKLLYEKDKYASLGMLLGGISHEIFNPLAGIYGPLENLEKIIENAKLENIDKAERYFESIFTNVKRVENIVKSLKILYYNKPFESESADLQKIVESIKEIFYNKIKDRVEIEIEIAKEFTLETNIGFLTQILLNLISNSIDAIKGSGKVRIIAKNYQNRKVLIVSDNGEGIFSENIDKLFNAFWTTKEVGSGTGLGLYIVKDIVIKLNWSIDVKSKIDEGTDFIITI